ncbi:MAG: hypothetical protein RR916_08150 [Anaerorhabdus sp.]
MRDELDLLISKGILEQYMYCKIDQVVLFSKDLTVNYFTHVDFSSNYTEKSHFDFLSKRPLLKIGEYELAISSYTITVSEFILMHC